MSVRLRRPVVLVLVTLCLAHSRAEAALQQVSLSAVATAVAGYWSVGDADGIARVLSEAGVSLHLFDESHAATGIRQARAALAQLFGRGGTARVARVEELGGAPARGFAEIAWEVTSPGSPQGLRYVVFVGFVRVGESWRIAEIRVLR